jgi:hypothetical protein
MTSLKKPVRRVSASRAAKYGPDRDKRIVVTLLPGNGGDVPDMLELRPERTQRPERAALADVYQWLVKCRINAGVMAKLRERKAKKEAARIERARQRELRRSLQ